MSKKAKPDTQTDSTTPRTPTATTAWKNILETISVVTEDWKCQVTMLVESDPRDTTYLDKFSIAAKDDARMVIKSITYDETVNMIQQIGSGKDISPEDKIFELAHTTSKQGNPIPEDILALIIKHQVLTYKADDLKIKDAKREMSTGLQNESLIMMNNPDAQQSVTQNEKKFHTELRKLGEEWKDKIYIEDFPKDGPDLYIAIIGFRKCKIIEELLKIKVPLVAVVKLESVSEPLIVEAEQETNISNSSSSHSKLSKFSPEIAIFWEDLHLLKSSPEISELRGVAFISFEPPYKETLPEGMSENSIIYDEISFLLYDIQDLTRQHKHYIEKIKIINVDESAPNIQLENMLVYKNMLDSVPLECTTIAIMLYSMVAQVANENVHDLQQSLGENNTRTINKNTNTVTEAQGKINQIFKLKKINDKICESDTKPDDFEIIPWGDFTKLESYHCKSGSLDIRRITNDILSSLPVPRLWDRLPFDNRDSEADFKLKLFHDSMHEHNISIESASRLLNLMCCKKLCEEKFFYDYQLYQKSLRKIKKPRRSPISPIPSSTFLKSFSFTYGESPNVNHIECSLQSVQRFISTTECSKPSHFDDIIDILETQRPSFETEYKEQNFDVNDYDSFEELTRESMLQALNKAYFEFNTSNIKYCPISDKMIIVFFNKKFNGMNKFQWQRYIPSPVCLRDFFEYVFDEVYDWIVAEERIHDASMIGSGGDALNERGHDVISEEVTIDYDKDMILKNSLKYSDSVNSETVLDNLGPPPIVNDNGKQKDKTSTSKSRNKNADNSGETRDEEESFKFVGFNLGDDCVMTSGKSYTFFSKDGTAIFVDIYNNFDVDFYSSVHLTTSNYDLFIHNSFDALTERVGDVRKIRLASKSGMNLVFSKSKTSSENVTNSSDILYQPYHYLQFSWPNGLFVEPVWTQGSNLPLYIKQSILSNGSKCSNVPGELYRCCSINGEILIYKDNGDVKILCPDSSVYLCMQSSDANSFDARKEFKDSIDDFLNADESFGEPSSARPSNFSKTSVFKDKLVGDFLNYDATVADGSYFKVRDGSVVFEDKILVRTAVDYLMGEVYSRRLDGTNVLLNTEGVQTATFSDGSKISSYFILENDTSSPKTKEHLRSFNQSISYSESDLVNKHSFYVIEESPLENDNDEETLSINLLDDFVIVNLVYVMEHSDYASVTVNTLTRLVTINLPHKMLIQIEENGCYKLEFENLSTLELNEDELIINDTKCFDCTSQSTTKINLTNSENTGEILLTSKDCFNKLFEINYFGECFLTESDEDCCNGMKCDDIFCCLSLQRKNRRLFALKRDLSGEEYHHKETVNLFKSDVEGVNWSSTKTDQDVFNPEITYETTIFPVSLASSQAWVMEPLIIDVKPKNLTHADLMENKPKSIYAWMRPYSRKTFYYDNGDIKVTQPTPPKAMILRIFRKIIPNDWNILKNMELIIEKYICLMRKERKATKSLTPLTETLISDDELTKIGHQMYSEILKSFDKQCVLSSARKSKDMTVQLSIKKLLEQRAKEKLMEEFYREALRTRHVPKYDYSTLNRESGRYAEDINIIEQ